MALSVYGAGTLRNYGESTRRNACRRVSRFATGPSIGKRDGRPRAVTAQSGTLQGVNGLLWRTLQRVTVVRWERVISSPTPPPPPFKVTRHLVEVAIKILLNLTDCCVPCRQPLHALAIGLSRRLQTSQTTCLLCQPDSQIAVLTLFSSTSCPSRATRATYVGDPAHHSALRTVEDAPQHRVSARFAWV